ncbi:hypothetical protein [Streptomyces sp. NPDC090135]|uniref:hypothetical protein n=1 Tax=Streptomyces sp. NPDC090135 TaxID=3365957 RepID=UPI00381F22C3
MSKYNIPADVEDAVLRLVYSKAAQADWLALSDDERTRLYQRWTDDPEIGGRLIGHLDSAANVRPWLKDGPMKEYQRALRGGTKYAKYVSKPAATIEEIIEKTLGGEWEVVPRSKRQKPMRAKARKVGSEDEELHFVVGSSSNFKNLLWPAILDRSNGQTAPWTICVIDAFTSPVTREERATHERVARFLGVRVIYFQEM